MGVVLGWPTLDHPQFPGGGGLGWINKRDGVEYSALGVTIPRLDDHRKQCYFNSCQLYKNSSGQLLKVDDESKDECNLIPATQDMRAATMMADDVPTAKMERTGLRYFHLEPGERVGVSVKWEKNGRDKVEHCSTHPDAPYGLKVLPGLCDSSDTMLVMVENE